MNVLELELIVSIEGMTEAEVETPVIATPAPALVSEWVMVVAAVVVLLGGSVLVTLTAVGWFNAGCPSLTPVLHQMLGHARQMMGL